MRFSTLIAHVQRHPFNSWSVPGDHLQSMGMTAYKPHPAGILIGLQRATSLKSLLKRSDIKLICVYAMSLRSYKDQVRCAHVVKRKTRSGLKTSLHEFDDKAEVMRTYDSKEVANNRVDIV